MSRLQEYYQYVNIGKVLPNFWSFVEPRFIEREDISLDQIKNIDSQIQIFDITSPEGVTNLSSKSKELFSKLQGIYQRGVKHYQKNQVPVDYISLILPQYQQYLSTNPPQQVYEFQVQQQQLLYQQQMYYQQVNYQQQSSQGYHQGNNYNQNRHQDQDQGHRAHHNDHRNTAGNHRGYNQGQQGYYQNQQQGYQNQQQGYQNQQQQYNNYQNQQAQTQNTYSNESQSQQTQQTQQAQSQQLKYVEKQESIEQTPVTVEKKTQAAPPKPEKKKMSIEQIRAYVTATATNKDLLKKSVSESLIKEIDEINKWVKKTENVEVTVQSYGGGKKQERNNNNNNNNRGEFNKGKKYEPSGDQQFKRGPNRNNPPPTAPPSFDIQIGKNENLETRIIKKQLAEKASKTDFAAEKKKQQDSMDKISKAKVDILYNLNRVAPENVKDIFNELTEFAVSDEQICHALVESVIQKAWEQPKYAASYAKLSSYFAKLDGEKFKYVEEKDKKKNPFKYILIEKVQHSFDKKEKKETPQIQDKDKFAKETKNLIIGNVKFIAELIKIKLIPKKTIKYCISQLINSFLANFYDFFKNGVIEFNFYEFYFEAVIEFLENLGDKYEQIDEKEEGKTGYESIEKKVIEFCELKNNTTVEGLDNISANEYFVLFNTIKKYALVKSKDAGRLSALLQNLQERRTNKWKKHNVESEGPKKLKDLKYDEEASTEQKQKVDLAQLDDRMSKLLKKWVENEKKIALDEIDSLGKKYSNKEEILSAYLKEFSNDKKDALQNRIQLFNVIFEKYLNVKIFKDAWKGAISNVALLASEYPFSAAAVAKILIYIVNEKKGGKFQDYFIKFDEDEQEEEYYFINEVFQKVLHYTQEESIKSLIEPKAKLTHIL